MTRRRLPIIVGIAWLTFLAGLAYAVSAVPALTEIDAAFEAALVPSRTTPLLAVFLWITTLGSGATLFAVAAIATGLLWSGTSRPFLHPFWVVYLGTEAMTWSIKFGLNRARPAFLDMATATSPSFPSAHTAGSAAVYGFLAYIIAQRLTVPARPAILAAVALTVAAVAFSRVFLRVHFLSDVVGGFLIAGTWLCIGVLMACHARR